MTCFLTRPDGKSFVMPKRPHSVTVNGKRWRLKWEYVPRAFGECDLTGRGITVQPNMDNASTLDILVHEMLHARWPDLDEDAVNGFASDVAVAAQRCGLIAGDE